MIDHEHLSCAREHRRQAEALLDTAVHGWGCVIAFYSAYHHAKWALLRDPRFDDFEGLRAIHPRLIPDDRYSQQHQARRGPQQTTFGINDLMGLLYEEVAVDYVGLHAASIDVRYKRVDTWAGLPPGGYVLDALTRIEEHLAVVTLSRG